MELFSEVYGCYFTVVSRILNQAQNGMTKAEIEQLVDSHGFYDSTFHLLPSLFFGEWKLLDEREGAYFSKIDGKTKRPLTTLEKSWLKALLNDSRMRLFLDDAQYNELQNSLTDVKPLFLQDDFHLYDRQLDGDDYEDTKYIEHFKTILQATKEKMPLMIEYRSDKGGRTKRQYDPYRLCYSARDDKFRLLCAEFQKNRGRLKRITLNLARITSVQLSESRFDKPVELDALYAKAVCREPVVLEISKERNALERCMLQFASFERQTEYDRERNRYTCRVWYDPADETELLIRVLSFGPTVRVLGPASFLKQMHERIHRQVRLDNMIIHSASQSD